MEAANQAKTWLWASFGIGLLVQLAYIAVIVAGGLP
jgi:hypothetical protein